ncbi:MAG: preprotein translocase subunit SecA, partial [Raineya sp.]|nr:preprotein translocase subunit SecA [Raineya sp.]
TQELKIYIRQKLQPLDEQIAQLRKQVAENPQMNIVEQEKIFNKIDELEKEHDKQLEKVLDEILPQSFAIVKETARRFKENEVLEVTATDFDRELATKKDNIKIEGDKALWYNSWVAAGNRITWDMVHYDVQIIGGVVLHKGKIAEMATGEGKTLVATLPAFLNALGGKGVHIVTVNDYLARRDSEWMGPIYEFHGLRVDCIDKHRPNSPARRNAYLADITYGTNNEFGFDYLRDNMVGSPDELVQRKLHYAMVDEVDSVLIDDARTPLIIAGPVSRTGQEEMFYALKPRVERLVNAQKQIVNEFLNEARKKIQAGETKEGGLALFRAFRGLPKNRPLIKYLSEPGIKTILQKTEAIYLADNQRLMPEADAPLYFTIDEKNNLIELTQKGIDFITLEGEDPNFFVLPDIGSEIAKIENNSQIDEKERAKLKEQLINDYTIKSERIHVINQLLKAYCLFEKDVEYVVLEGAVKIVDEQTGRILEGRRYSEGLHQALEAKENVKVEQATQTYATITLQNYFRMYHKLAGMTGTAETEAGEFWEIYKLDVVVIPTNKPVIRKDHQDLVYRTKREKFNAVIEEIVKLREQGRPVLVGTTSVETSELLSRMLSQRKIPHQVLNAKHHQKEAEIVAQAGISGTVTIATNMAGRGTDIKLTPESRAAGGLAIIGTERHESRRVDRQLRGRSGRQGDPGSSQFFVSLEDDLMRLFGSDRIAKIMDRIGMKEGEVIQHSWVTKSIERAQKKVEENNFGIRKRLLEYDDVMNIQREQIYKRRRNALFGERLQLDLYTTMFEVCRQMVENMLAPDNFKNFETNFIAVFGFTPQIDISEFHSKNATNLIRKLFHQASEHYRLKMKQLAEEQLAPTLKIQYEQTQGKFQNIAIPFTDGKKNIYLEINFAKAIETNGWEVIRELEKNATLAIIDQEWKEHLRDMDDLKQSVQMASYEQKDPLLVYKFEAFELFKAFITRVNRDIISFLSKAEIFVPQQQVQPLQQEIKTPNTNKNLKQNKEQYISSMSNEYFDPSAHTTTTKTQPIRSRKIADRNQKVNVMYNDGRVVRDIKFKKIEADLLANKCILID